MVGAAGFKRELCSGDSMCQGVGSESVYARAGISSRFGPYTRDGTPPASRTIIMS
jgi:hypothetical protein